MHCVVWIEININISNRQNFSLKWKSEGMINGESTDNRNDELASIGKT